MLSKFLALSLFVLYFFSATGPVRSQRVSLSSSLQQDCTLFAPQQCEFQAVKKSDGDYDYSSYHEICSNETHTCASVDVRKNSYEWTSPSGIKLLIEPSYCNFEELKTGAFRLQKDTGLPLGKLEDRYAKCLTENLNLKLLVSNCRDLKLWTCDDCLTTYKRWACTTIFKKCSGTNPSVTELPCRDTCFDTVRKCPANLEFTCPGSDERDYSDLSSCYTLSTTV